MDWQATAEKRLAPGHPRRWRQRQGWRCAASSPSPATSRRPPPAAARPRPWCARSRSRRASRWRRGGPERAHGPPAAAAALGFSGGGEPGGEEGAARTLVATGGYGAARAAGGARRAGPDEEAGLDLGLDLDCLMRSSRDMSRPLDMVPGGWKRTGPAAAGGRRRRRCAAAAAAADVVVSCRVSVWAAGECGGCEHELLFLAIRFFFGFGKALFWIRSARVLFTCHFKTSLNTILFFQIYRGCFHKNSSKIFIDR